MRYRKRSNDYKSENNYLSLSPVRAKSYNWWTYCTVIGGLVVFNYYRYSSTMAGHQRKTLELLRKHNIEVDVMLCTPTCLSQSNALESSIKLYQDKIDYLEKLIDAKGTKKSKNLERAFEVFKLREKMAMVAALDLLASDRSKRKAFDKIPKQTKIGRV